ncbi:MAG TPA: tetratricopeptide repeat protein [Thermoanaerobaculia bacterium]|nr:tetratricopeptide repeat protein [Thermoanaerobaculia bacterium]
MKRLLLIAAAVLATTGCTVVRDANGTSENPYVNPFYAKYLNTGSTLDTQIARTLDALRQDPESPELHNTLGALLVEKGFSKDAEREFERAVDTNRKYYPAWYNLGLVRASRGDEIGARRAFMRTVDLKPGHAAALFQLGLVEEQRDHIDRAIDLYAKAYSINPALLDVDVNPRILDTKLTHLALLKLYPNAHTRGTMQFQGGGLSGTGGLAPATNTPGTPTAPSPQPSPRDIVPPAAPAPTQGARPAASVAPATTVGSPAASVAPAEQSPARRDTRGRRRGNATMSPEDLGAPANPPGQVELIPESGITPNATAPTTRW